MGRDNKKHDKYGLIRLLKLERERSCGLIERIDNNVKVFHYTDILNKDGGNSIC